ncbi:hypothetical protein ABLV18_27475 [Klebsiella sp. CN_Kp114]|uniref:hypothetical protein n=1 Tax=unclassified Klebsiella TaxID=2608929 RepID=UPI0032B52680
MNNQIEVGSLVFCYRTEGCRGRCEGLKAVTALEVRDGTIYYIVTSSDDPMYNGDYWYTAGRLQLAQRPPVGTETKFKIGDRVHCFGTYHIYCATGIIEHIVWFEGKPDYYVTPTATPWYGYNDNSLQLAIEPVRTVSELESLVF